jgi:hypothetical protein
LPYFFDFLTVSYYAMLSLSTQAQTALKRAVLGLVAVLESFSFYILTNARFEGQGLMPQFFRFTTKSDAISNILYLFTLILLLRAFISSSAISFRRALFLMGIVFVLLGITLGAQNFEAGEFPRLASITYLTCRALFLAVLIPRREYDLAHFAGIMQVVRNTILTLFIATIVAFIFSFTYNVSSDYSELKRFDALPAEVREQP